MTNSNGFRRVVVTGTGVVTPLGSSVDQFWNGLKTGASGIGPIASFETQDLYITIAGECSDFELGKFRIERRYFARYGTYRARN